MPNNPRQQVKRKLEQASNALETALGHLKDASEPYRPGATHHKPEGYPEYFEPMDQVAANLINTQEVIDSIRLQV